MKHSGVWILIGRTTLLPTSNSELPKENVLTPRRMLRKRVLEVGALALGVNGVTRLARYTECMDGLRWR